MRLFAITFSLLVITQAVFVLLLFNFRHCFMPLDVTKGIGPICALVPIVYEWDEGIISARSPLWLHSWFRRAWADLGCGACKSFAF